MSNFVLETARLRLRHMTIYDKNQLSKIFNDPIAMKYYASTKNEEETIRWIYWTENNYRKFGVGLWIVEDKQSGEFLGQCGLVPQKIDGKVQMEIGYLFVRKVWGNGYATEAAKGCIQYGMSQLKIPKVISLIDPNNESSIKVATRIGMTFEKMIEKRGKELHLYSCLNNTPKSV